MRFSAFQLAVVAPGKPTSRLLRSALHCPGSPYRRRDDHPLRLGSGGVLFLPLSFPAPPRAARAPAAAELPQPLTARPEHLAAWSLGLRGGAGRGGASARGAGRARARRRGGSARAAPKRAELGGASERQAEPGRLPAAQRPSCCVVGLRLPTTFAQAPAKLLFSWAPPGCLKESEHSAGSALPCSSGDLADVHPSPAGLSRSAPPHLLITPRSDEGAPAEGPRGRQRPRTLSLTAADLPRATLT